MVTWHLFRRAAEQEQHRIERLQSVCSAEGSQAKAAQQRVDAIDLHPRSSARRLATPPAGLVGRGGDPMSTRTRSTGLPWHWRQAWWSAWRGQGRPTVPPPSEPPSGYGFSCPSTALSEAVGGLFGEMSFEPAEDRARGKEGEDAARVELGLEGSPGRARHRDAPKTCPKDSFPAKAEITFAGLGGCKTRAGCSCG
jgi:hypothetical protein